MSIAAPLAFAVNRLTDIHAVPRRTADGDACIAGSGRPETARSRPRKYRLTLLHKHFDLEAARSWSSTPISRRGH